MYSNREDDGHGQQPTLILPTRGVPTTSSNFHSSIKVGLGHISISIRMLDANKSFPSSLNPLGVELDSVSTQQGSSMKRTESEVDHNRRDISLVAPRTYEETSSEAKADMVARLNALLLPERKHQHEEEIGLGSQKKM